MKSPEWINDTLVHRLVAVQFPQWKNLSVRPVALSGWDNRTFHLGFELKDSLVLFNQVLLKRPDVILKLFKLFIFSRFHGKDDTKNRLKTEEKNALFKFNTGNDRDAFGSTNFWKG